LIPCNVALLKPYLVTGFYPPPCQNRGTQFTTGHLGKIIEEIIRIRFVFRIDSVAKKLWSRRGLPGILLVISGGQLGPVLDAQSSLAGLALAPDVTKIRRPQF
jgi:hypothetical protein